MVNAELMKLEGKKVNVFFKNGRALSGVLRYADDFSKKHDFRKPKFFYIGNTSFLVSHVKRVEESEEQG